MTGQTLERKNDGTETFQEKKNGANTFYEEKMTGLGLFLRKKCTYEMTAENFSQNKIKGHTLFQEKK